MTWSNKPQIQTLSGDTNKSVPKYGTKKKSNHKTTTTTDNLVNLKHISFNLMVKFIFKWWKLARTYETCTYAQWWRDHGVYRGRGPTFFKNLFLFTYKITLFIIL